MPKKILLADDSITIQKVVELTFSDGDYEVIATNNGNKAIQKLAEARPDIILSDIIMPEKNGYELCEYIKSHPDYRHIPVILLTGTFEPFDPDRAEKAGCDAVITKPFESQSLIHKVEELIQQSSAPKAATAASASVAEGRPMQEPPTFTSGTESEARPWASPPKLDLGWKAEQTTTPPPALAEKTAAAKEEPAEYGETTKAFPKVSFEDLKQPPSAPAESREPEADYSAATKAFPKMSFEDLKRSASDSATTDTGPWTPPSETTPTSEWAAAESETSFAPSEPLKADDAAPFGEEPESRRETSGSIFDTSERPAWPESPAVSPPTSEARMAESPPSGSPSPGGDLSDEQIDRIARRVVELMSEQVVRNIAWEVIPDLAEMVVRERIKQLESEA